MNNLVDEIIKYICLNYPYKYKLSKARLTKMVYLIDWYYSKLNKHQMTNISWEFNHYGPYVKGYNKYCRKRPRY